MTRNHRLDRSGGLAEDPDPRRFDRGGAALALHWRLRQQAIGPGALGFEQFVADYRWATLSTTGLRLRARDLLLADVPVSEADEALF